MNAPSPFIAIVDKNGDVWETLSRNCSMQNIKSVVEHNDRSRAWSAPHSALLWNGAVWYPFKIH